MILTREVSGLPKKKIAVCGLAVALAVACLLLLFYKGSDELTFFRRQNVNQMLQTNPFEQDGGGNNITMPIAVAAGTDGYGTDEFLGVRNQLDYSTGAVEVRVAVTADNKPVLADSFADIGNEPVTLGRVIVQMKKDGAEKLIVNLSEYSRLYAVNSLLRDNDILSKTIITGVSENAVKYVKSFFTGVCVLCDYGKANKRSLEEIAADGADGVLCTASEFDAAVLKRAGELGLDVWVDCGSDIYATVYALSSGVSGVITSRPELTFELTRVWSRDSLKVYLRDKK